MSVENLWSVDAGFVYYNHDSTKMIDVAGWSLKDISDFAAWLEDMLSETVRDVT